MKKIQIIVLVLTTIVVIAMAINFKSIHAHLLAAEPFARLFSCIGIAAVVTGFGYQLFQLGKGGK
jgi:hypothetical protein